MTVTAGIPTHPISSHLTCCQGRTTRQSPWMTVRPGSSSSSAVHGPFPCPQPNGLTDRSLDQFIQNRRDYLGKAAIEELLRKASAVYRDGMTVGQLQRAAGVSRSAAVKGRKGLRAEQEGRSQ